MWEVNHDLDEIVTPVDVNALDFLLQDTNYMEDERNFIKEGFRFGFSLGYQGPQVRKTARNCAVDCI